MDDRDLAEAFADYYRMKSRKRLRRAMRAAEARQQARIDLWLANIDFDRCVVAQLDGLLDALCDDPIEAAENARRRRKRELERFFALL